MIEVKNLTKKFGNITAVDRLTFHINEGEIFGLLGSNGAGKTTTMRILCCLISKTSGEAKIAGYEIGNNTNPLEIRKIIGLVPENVGLYNELSAYENLDFYGKLYECPEQQRKENIEYFLKMMGLWDKRNQSVGSFSRGMKQKMVIARALIHNPKLLFLDEPTLNLDPESSKVVIDFILKLKKEGRTIFLNTHNLNVAQRICDKISILKTKLLTITTPDQLKKFLWGSRTVIQLEKITNSILTAVKKLKPKSFEVNKNKIIIEVTDPLRENSNFIKAIVSAGGSILYSIIGFQVLVSIVSPLIIQFAGAKKGGISVDVLPRLIDAFSFWFVIGATVLPISIASYSLIGEKIEGSLEPLLATPTTDEEILVGKGLAAFIPTIVATYLGAVIFMFLIDTITYNKLMYLYFPNWNFAVMVLLLAPLVNILSIEINVIISSRVNDIRIAQQLGGLLISLPFVAMYFLSMINVISLTTNNLLIILVILLFIDVIFFYLVKAIFHREEILTKWK